MEIMLFKKWLWMTGTTAAKVGKYCSKTSLAVGDLPFL
jgi:hypothetical protein